MSTLNMLRGSVKIVADGATTGDLEVTGKITESSPQVKNVPTTLLVTDSDSHDVITLTAGKDYTVTLKNASVADGGAVTNYVEGWIKTADAGGSVAAEGGQPLVVNAPVVVRPVTGKLHLYFRRNSDTAFACRLFVNLEDS